MMSRGPTATLGGRAYAQSKLATPVSTVEEGAILNLATSEELAGRSGDFYNVLRSAKQMRRRMMIGRASSYGCLACA